jgi:hypothetical protein
MDRACGKDQILGGGVYILEISKKQTKKYVSSYDYVRDVRHLFSSLFFPTYHCLAEKKYEFYNHLH